MIEKWFFTCNLKKNVNFRVKLILSELWEKKMIFHMRSYNIVHFRVKLVLRELWAKNGFSIKKWFFTCKIKKSQFYTWSWFEASSARKKMIFHKWSQNIVLFRVKFILWVLWAKNDFLKKIIFSHEIIKSRRPLPRNFHIKG